mgnify:CR=1 FL=1
MFSFHLIGCIIVLLIHNNESTIVTNMFHDNASCISRVSSTTQYLWMYKKILQFQVDGLAWITVALDRSFNVDAWVQTILSCYS